MNIKNKKVGVVVLAAALAVPAAAQAHVTLQPSEAPAGGFARLDVRVPNESDSAATNKVEVQMPDGFASASYEPVTGWSTEVKMEKVDEPIELHGEEVTEQIDTITWTADSSDVAIEPGQFQDFGISVAVPDEAPGTALEFPSIQTYDDGEVVRWIQPPDSEEDPAPTVTLTAPEEEHGATDEAEDAAEDAAEGAEEAATDAADDASDDDGGSDGLAIAGLVVGALGLITGGTALARSRRS